MNLGKVTCRKVRWGSIRGHTGLRSEQESGTGIFNSPQKAEKHLLVIIYTHGFKYWVTLWILEKGKLSVQLWVEHQLQEGFNCSSSGSICAPYSSEEGIGKYGWISRSKMWLNKVQTLPHPTIIFWPCPPSLPHITCLQRPIAAWLLNCFVSCSIIVYFYEFFSPVRKYSPFLYIYSIAF